MKKILTLSLILSGISFLSFAGNKDRAGQAGASELLINPWARSSGWQGLNTAGVHGLEAINLNCAGLAFTNKTEILFSRTSWLQGSGVNINSFGFSQRLGKNGGVMAVSVMSISFGDINITTTSLPEGGIGTYSPQFSNVSLGYSKEFSKSIYCGFVVKGISESISDANALGFALDAGIQYQTGSKKFPDKVKFGITLRNIGTPMKYGGDGLSTRASSLETGATTPSTYVMTVEERSQGFELPSLLNIGFSYDFHLGDGTNRLTMASNFTSNSFSQDQIGLGAEFALKEKFMLRAGYNYEKGLLSTTERRSALTGISAGLTIDIPVKENGPHVELDYSYRTSNPWGGVHSIGLRIAL